MKELKVDEEFKRIIPPIGYDEYQDLEDSLRKEGCRDPLVVWDGILLDGHNRYNICQMYGIEFNTVEVYPIGRDEAKIWIIKNQLARRNLNPAQIKKLRGDRYNIEKGKHGGDKKSKGQNDRLANTAKNLAKEYGVSERTVRRDGKFAEKVNKLPDEEKRDVLSGKKSIDEAIRKFNETPISELENASQKVVESVKNEPKPKDSYNLRQLKYFWKRTNKTDRKRFILWANIKKGENK